MSCETNWSLTKHSGRLEQRKSRTLEVSNALVILSRPWGLSLEFVDKRPSLTREGTLRLPRVVLGRLGRVGLTGQAPGRPRAPVLGGLLHGQDGVCVHPVEAPVLRDHTHTSRVGLSRSLRSLRDFNLPESRWEVRRLSGHEILRLESNFI